MSKREELKALRLQKAEIAAQEKELRETLNAERSKTVEQRKALTQLRRLFIQRRAIIIKQLPKCFEAVTKAETVDEVSDAAEVLEEATDELISLMMKKKKVLAEADGEPVVPDLSNYEDKPQAKRPRTPAEPIAKPPTKADTKKKKDKPTPKKKKASKKKTSKKKK